MEDFENSLEHYLKSGGVSCLFCGSGEIEGGFISIDEGSAKQPVICLDCEAEWTDLYKLTNIDNVTKPGATLVLPARKEVSVDG